MMTMARSSTAKSPLSPRAPSRMRRAGTTSWTRRAIPSTPTRTAHPWRTPSSRPPGFPEAAAPLPRTPTADRPRTHRPTRPAPGPPIPAPRRLTPGPSPPVPTRRRTPAPSRTSPVRTIRVPRRRGRTAPVRQCRRSPFCPPTSPRLRRRNPSRSRTRSRTLSPSRTTRSPVGC